MLQMSAILTSEVHSVKAGGQIASKLSNLILNHHPMKEEQNASSSANYDVEIFHSSAAHTSILEGLKHFILQLHTHLY
jgi:hypothetical protein